MGFNFEIIGSAQVSPKNQTLHPRFALDGEEIRYLENHGYCPCCDGWGGGSGIRFCGYCEDGSCGQERLSYDKLLANS